MHPSGHAGDDRSVRPGQSRGIDRVARIAAIDRDRRGPPVTKATFASVKVRVLAPVLASWIIVNSVTPDKLTVPESVMTSVSSRPLPLIAIPLSPEAGTSTSQPTPTPTCENPTYWLPRPDKAPPVLTSSSVPPPPTARPTSLLPGCWSSARCARLHDQHAQILEADGGATCPVAAGDGAVIGHRRAAGGLDTNAALDQRMVGADTAVGHDAAGRQ